MGIRGFEVEGSQKYVGGVEVILFTLSYGTQLWRKKHLGFIEFLKRDKIYGKFY